MDPFTNDIFTFTNDIFISYRHLDNEPVSGTTGWIDDFHKKLKTQLGFKLGYEPVIWRDRKLGGSEDFAGVLLKELKQSKFLISILSRGYVNPDKEWCMKELSEFHQLTKGHVVQLGEKSRCIKVVKSFLDREKHPTQLQGVLGYEFYEVDEESGRPQEFSYLPDGDHHPRYRKKIDELAYELSELILAFDAEVKRLKEKGPEPPPPSPPSDPEHNVYLAETSSDRSDYRDSIKSELLSRGFRVLPDRELPNTPAEYRLAVSENLKQAGLSIHLIGEKYARVLQDDESSVVEIQNDLAAEVNAGPPNFSRLIWIAPDLAPVGKLQPAFIDRLRTSKEAQNGAELMERPFEELKNRIMEKLTSQKSTVIKFPPTDGDQDLVRIYLMYDKLDFASVTAIRDYLYDKNENYEVILAAREDGGETVQAQVIQYHKDNLLECDAALVYYGHGNEFWLHSKVSDLRKVRIWGRERPLLKGIYLADPQTEHKQTYKIREAVLLQPPGYGGVSKAALDEFIAYIESARAEQPKTGSGGAR
jgi:hypothetical protein